MYTLFELDEHYDMPLYEVADKKKNLPLAKSPEKNTLKSDTNLSITQ